MATERKKRVRTKEKRENASFGVLVVQCVACVIVVLFVWLFSSFGGASAKQLRDFLSEQLRDNSLATAVAVWIDERLTDEKDTNVSEPSDDTSEYIEDQKTDATFVASVSPSMMEYSETATMALPIARSAGRVTSLYGNRDNPTDEGEEFHKGLDIAAEKGTDIVSMMFGIVTETGTDYWLGNYVVVSHGDLEVTYAHCSKVIAKPGLVVKAGETVAKVGSTGNSTGNHLHIELRKDGALCDPATVMSVSAYD